MARYRHALPQLGDGIFLSDGGMETTLIFHEGVELPHFASFVLLETEAGRQHLLRLLRALSQDRPRQPRRLPARQRRLARQSRLGRQARLRRQGAHGDQRGVDRAARRATRQMGNTGIALRDRRRHRAARRWLQGWQDGRRRGRRLSRAAGRGLCRDRGRHGIGLHHEQHRRGDRRSACGACPCHAVHDLVHRRDRRQAGHRQLAARGDRDRRRAKRADIRSTT